MAVALAPCPHCDRHVRVDEQKCPFCESPIRTDEALKRVIPGAAGQMPRSAMIVFAATLGLAGCSSTTNPGDAGGDVVATDAVSDDGSLIAMYGAPADANREDGNIAPPYGIPPRDE